MKKWLKLVSLALVFTLTLGVFAMGAIGVSADVTETDKLGLYRSEVPFEYPGEYRGIPALITRCQDAGTIKTINDALQYNNDDHTAKGHAVVNLNGQDYTISHYVNAAFSDSDEIFRFVFDHEGFSLVRGVEYKIKISIYNEQNELVLVTKEIKCKSSMFHNVEPGELTATDNLKDQTNSCGFIDDDIRFTRGFMGVETLTDITVEVNGKPAYWNIGYMGMRHCNFSVNDPWIQCGIVGAEIKKGTNTIKFTMGTSGDTYSQTFNSTFESKGVAYSNVTADKVQKTVSATIVYFTDPGYKVGDELTGKCHDEHPPVKDPANSATFKVTAVDGNKVTLEATNYVPGQSLLELQDENGVYTTVTINSATDSLPLPQALSTEDTQKVKASAAKQEIASGKVENLNNGPAGATDFARLIDGQSSTKIEGNFGNGNITITFETESAVTANWLILRTQDDGKPGCGNRAAGKFTLYGSTDGNIYTPIKEVPVSGIQNVNDTYFAFYLGESSSYQHYKLEVFNCIDGGRGYFQLAELELYTGTVDGVTVPANEAITTIGDSDAYNGSTAAYIQFRKNVDGYYDARLLVLNHSDLLALYKSAKMTLVFKNENGGVVNTKDRTVDRAYTTVNAAGEKVTAPDGYGYIGLIITDIPYGAANSISCTIEFTTESGDTLVFPVGSADLPANAKEID